MYNSDPKLNPKSDRNVISGSSCPIGKQWGLIPI